MPLCHTIVLLEELASGGQHRPIARPWSGTMLRATEGALTPELKRALGIMLAGALALYLIVLASF
jgi:hypothetical protein